LEATTDLAVTVLCVDLGQAKSDRGICEDGIFVAAQCFINRNFGSHELSPDSVAARLGCSRAHLYRVFGRHEMTVAGYIREVRLQRSHAALTAASAWRDSIGDIAFRCGFANPVYFAHLFLDRFGTLPSELRATATERPSSGEGLPKIVRRRFRRQ
jgi:AraC-like DNA-binding protein